MKQLAFVCLALVTACSGAASDPAVSMTEFGISVDGRLSSGTTTMRVENNGEFGHTLVVSEANGTVVLATDVIAPGEFADVEMDLASGEYQFSCRIVVESGQGHLVDHYAEGMATDVVIP